MLFGLLLAASLIFLQPMEYEAESYIQDAHKTSEYMDGSAKIIELNNGVTFRFREKDSTLMRFDLSAGGMSYGNLTIGKELKKLTIILPITSMRMAQSRTSSNSRITASCTFLQKTASYER